MRPSLLLGVLALGLSACTVTVNPGIAVRPSLALQVVPDRLITRFQPDRGVGSSYAVGSTIRFSLSVRDPGYVTLVSLDPDGRGNVLVRNAPVRAGTTVFPRAQDGASSFGVVPPRGVQRVRAIFTRVQPSAGIVFQGTYSAGRWNDATSAYVQAYSPNNRDVEETFFYIR